MFGFGRVIKYGDRGRLVKVVQHNLAALGYEIGPLDGKFGLLTEEAVESFQRDFQLEPDGIAGPKTLEVLEAKIPERFKIHKVRGGETLRSIAQRYAVAGRVLASINNLRDFRVTPGQHLKIPCRVLLGFQKEDIQPTESLFHYRDRLDALISPGLSIRQDLISWMAKHNLPLWSTMELPQDKQHLSDLLLSKKRTKVYVKELFAGKSTGVRGLIIVPPADMPLRYRFLLNRLARMVRQEADWALISSLLPYPADSVGAFDYSILSGLCDFLLFPPEPDSQELGRKIRTALREVPCWKLIMGIDGTVYDRYLSAKIAMINKYNLGGACIFGVGREWDSVWTRLGQEFRSGEIIPASGS